MVEGIQSGLSNDGDDEEENLVARRSDLPAEISVQPGSTFQGVATRRIDTRGDVEALVCDHEQQIGGEPTKWDIRGGGSTASQKSCGEWWLGMFFIFLVRSIFVLVEGRGSGCAVLLCCALLDRMSCIAGFQSVLDGDVLYYSW